MVKVLPLVSKAPLDDSQRRVSKGVGGVLLKVNLPGPHRARLVTERVGGTRLVFT